MPVFLYLLPHACLLIASILLLRPLLFKRERRAALFRSVNLARPSITLLDGAVMLAVILFFLAFNLLGEYFSPNDTKAGQLSLASLVLGLSFHLIWIAPALAILLRGEASLPATFGINRATAWRDIRLGVRYGVMMLFPVFVVGGLTHLAFGFFNLPAKPQDSILQLLDPGVPAALKVLFGVYAVTLVPVIEEAAFRGVLFPAFARVEPFLAILVYQAFLFSLIHLNAVAAPALFVVGVCLGLGYARTRSLLTPIVMHAVFNLNAMLSVLIYNLLEKAHA